jgi:lactate dehydrogenase-like 2-hydroxyacid dehydrogenase
MCWTPGRRDAGTPGRHRAALKLVCVAATGTNNVDPEAAVRLGIPVCNEVAYGTPSVVQHTFALILALTPHTAWANREARQRVIDQVTENIIAVPPV